MGHASSEGFENPSSVVSFEFDHRLQDTVWGRSGRIRGGGRLRPKVSSMAVTTGLASVLLRLFRNKLLAVAAVVF